MAGNFQQGADVELQAERVKELNCGSCGTALEPAKYKPLSTVVCPKCGEKVHVPAGFGDLLLTGILGRGAAGVVCRALDVKLHRQVAVKILSDSMSDRELVDACKREAQAMARLNHRNIVQVHQIGQYRDQPFIVMEHLEGGSVEKLMIGKSEPISESEALRVVIDAAEGLGAAHRVHMIHLDVKPGNMLFDSTGTTKLIDFGTAAFAHHEGEDIGTPYYVAPEIVRGKKPDFRSDMFSLGATLYHILAGKPPFDGATVKDVIRARMKEPPADLREIRPDIHRQTAEVVMRMLAIDPDARYQSYDDLLVMLRGAKDDVDHGPAIARGPSTTRPLPKRKKSHAPMYVAGGILLAMVGLVVVIVTQIPGASQPPLKPTATDPIAPPIAPPPKVVQPVVNEPTIFVRDRSWKQLEIVGQPTSTGGSSLKPQLDQSIVATGRFPNTDDTYTVVVKTEPHILKAIGLEALADKSFIGGGPGRDGGSFFISSLTVEAAPAATPTQKQKLTLTKPDADIELTKMELANVLDDNPGTGWGIPASAGGVDHTATFTLDPPYVAAVPTLLTFTIKHESQQKFLGKFKLWALPSDEPVKAAVPVAPPKVVTPTPNGPPPPPPPPPPVASTFPAAAAPRFALADEGQWYVMDITSVLPSMATKFEKLADGSVLTREPVGTHDQTYTITAQTTLQNITALRIDLMADDALPKRGPGLGSDGNVAINEIDAAILAGGAPTKIEFASATATATQGRNAAGHLIDSNGATSWLAGPALGKDVTLVLKTKNPIAPSPTTTIVITINQKIPAGRLMLSATTNATPAAITPPPALRPPLSSMAWVPLPVTNFTSPAKAGITPQPDGSVLVHDGTNGKDTYELQVRADMPTITAIKLEFLHDPSLPKGGPGRVTSGWFAISEINLAAAPLDAPTSFKPIALTDPTADFASAPNVIERAVDLKPETFWGVQSRPGETRVASFKLSPAIQNPGGSVLTLKLDQMLSVGRFRVLATGMTDPAKIHIEAAKPDAPHRAPGAK